MRAYVNVCVCVCVSVYECELHTIVTLIRLIQNWQVSSEPNVCLWLYWMLSVLWLNHISTLCTVLCALFVHKKRCRLKKHWRSAMHCIESAVHESNTYNCVFQLSIARCSCSMCVYLSIYLEKIKKIRINKQQKKKTGKDCARTHENSIKRIQLSSTRWTLLRLILIWRYSSRCFWCKTLRIYRKKLDLTFCECARWQAKTVAISKGKRE